MNLTWDNHHVSYTNNKIPRTLDKLILSVLIFLPFINILIFAYAVQILRVSLYDEDPPNLKGALFFGVYGVKFQNWNYVILQQSVVF